MVSSDLLKLILLLQFEYYKYFDGHEENII